MTLRMEIRLRAFHVDRIYFYRKDAVGSEALCHCHFRWSIELNIERWCISLSLNNLTIFDRRYEKWTDKWFSSTLLCWKSFTEFHGKSRISNTSIAISQKNTVKTEINEGNRRIDCSRSINNRFDYSIVSFYQKCK